MTAAEADAKRTVLFAGGGTAGHVFPAIATARELVRRVPGLEPVFVGTADRLEDRLVPQAGFRLHHIPMRPVPRRLSPDLLKLPVALARSVKMCRDLIASENAVAAAVFGGYVSFPLAVAAAQRDLPLVIHEQNAIPGLANRFASRWADRVAVTFPGSADRFTRPERTAVTGNPVREEMLTLDLEKQAEARRHFGLHADRATLLVFGGSQGARSINRAIVAAQPHWTHPTRIQILHSAGDRLHGEAAAAWERARAETEQPFVRVVDFIDDMGLALTAADAIVCRAGATSIAELTVLGKPALLVPYPHATNDHQLHNARAVESAGGAVAIEDGDLDGETIVQVVEPWLLDPDARAEVSSAARAFGRRDAARNLVRLIHDLVQERP